MFDITGKVAVVTGAASGIGRAICVALAQSGASVVAALDLDWAGAEATGRLIVANGSRAVPIKCDAGLEGDIIAAVRRVEKEFGAPVSCFVANAGILEVNKGARPTRATVVADNNTWETCWKVNVMQSIYAARLVIPGMLKRQDGAFVVTSSAAGLFTFPTGDPSTYITTKHAVRSFADTLRVRYQQRGISVHCVCPKFVPSGMTSKLPEKLVQAAGGWVSADEVAQELLRCMKSGKYYVFSHEDTLESIQQAWEDIEGTFEVFAGTNAQTMKGSNM
eukprot:TRINITY_DN55706_c0_g1_i1.p1 TRINITY_DN55706_c0_g1~~TRINITY_DN55706_c0_g1_i1.p1  ORF type:complete len:277 (-),score=23.35 TRINITY_DN55706_c0_g1_i1:82-912(-)